MTDAPQKFSPSGRGLGEGASTGATILEVEDYTLDYHTRAGSLRVLDGISLAIAPNEVLGLVGESGSGKTSLAWAIMRALPANAREAGGTLRLLGADLRAMNPKQVEAMRGRRIGMVFQDPATTLNPTLTIGRQLAEVLMQHQHLDREAAWQASIEALRRVELRDPQALMHRYPHEASGGEKQRVGIAAAFACRPALIIFDEPTTALDVITGERVLELFRRLREQTNVAGLYISHDLALVSRVADRVAVIHRGRVQEQAPAGRIFAAPKAEYTRMLVQAVPRPDQRLILDAPGSAPLLALDNIGVRYGRPRLFGARVVTAVHAVNLEIRPGEILGVVGESGSGKSSIARAVTGLTPFTGAIHFAARRIDAPRDMDRAYKKAVQIVFQHPDSSLNPRHRVRDLLARPLRLFGASTAEIPRLLDQVRLPAAYAGRYPHQLSGGEKQRVAIARAFAARPRLVVCDEITAPLDVSVQAAIVQLLLELRREHGTAYLFITHDFNLVRQIAHRLAVMQMGQLVDLLAPDQLATAAPYTQALIAATPTPVGESSA